MSDQPQQCTCDCCGAKSDFVTHQYNRIWFCPSEQCQSHPYITIDGMKINLMFYAPIKPGDMYVAKRNTGWKLLTCKEVDNVNGFIVPVEPNAYYFDTHECIKVID